MAKSPPKTDDQLRRELGSLKPGTPKALQIEAELRRREQKWPTIRSWIAAIGAIGAALVALAAYLRT